MQEGDTVPDRVLVILLHIPSTNSIFFPVMYQYCILYIFCKLILHLKNVGKKVNQQTQLFVCVTDWVIFCTGDTTTVDRLGHIMYW